jgi:hypothetical protein
MVRDDHERPPDRRDLRPERSEHSRTSS